MDNLETAAIPIAPDDLLVLAQAANAVLMNSKQPKTVDGRLKRARLQGAVERASEALRIHDESRN